MTTSRKFRELYSIMRHEVKLECMHQLVREHGNANNACQWHCVDSWDAGVVGRWKSAEDNRVEVLFGRWLAHRVLFDDSLLLVPGLHVLSVFDIQQCLGGSGGHESGRISDSTSNGVVGCRTRAVDVMDVAASPDRPEVSAGTSFLRVRVRVPTGLAGTKTRTGDGLAN